MKFKISLMILGLASLFVTTSCSNSESYADQLRDERKAANAYLAQYRVVNEIPADTIFEVGENAPYYKLDPDGNVYMQVLVADSKENRPKTDQRVYFRYMSLDLKSWYAGNNPSLGGNAEDMLADPTFFLYNNYTLSSSSQYGYGIQLPLKFVGVNSKVNVIIKSQYGFTNYISYVIPYRFTVSYYPSKI